MSGRDRASRRGLEWLIAVPCAVVVVLSLAVSTHPVEYKAISGFVGKEHAYIGNKPFDAKKILHAQSLVLHVQSLNESHGDDNEPLDAQDLDTKAAEWVKRHPEEGQRLFLSTISGVIIAILGVVFLLTSEISTVMLVNDLDRHAMTGEPMSVELEERELVWGHGMSGKWRPWLSIGGVLIMIFGGLCMLLPVCSLLSDFGMDRAPSDCVTTVVLLAVVESISWAALLTACCWACTRGWASLLLTWIAFSSSLIAGINSPVLFIFWAICTGFLCTAYLTAAPEAREGYRENPYWFSDPGPGRRPPQQQYGSTGMGKAGQKNPQTEDYV